MWCKASMPMPETHPYCICHDLDGQYDCTDKECHENMKWLVDMGMRADKNGDGGVDHNECAELEDEFEGWVCHELVAHCGGDD